MKQIVSYLTTFFVVIAAIMIYDLTKPATQEGVLEKCAEAECVQIPNPGGLVVGGAYTGSLTGGGRMSHFQYCGCVATWGAATCSNGGYAHRDCRFGCTTGTVRTTFVTGGLGIIKSILCVE